MVWSSVIATHGRHNHVVAKQSTTQYLDELGTTGLLPPYIIRTCFGVLCANLNYHHVPRISAYRSHTHQSHTHSNHTQKNKSNHNKPHRSTLAVTCVARGGRMGHSSTTHPSSFVFKPWHLQASSMTTGDGDVSSAKAEGGIPAHAVAMSSSGRRFALMSYFGPPAGEAGELAADPPAPDPPAPDPPAPDADRGEVSFDTVMDIAASGMPRSSPAMNAKGMALGRRVVCSA